MSSLSNPIYSPHQAPAWPRLYFQSPAIMRRGKSCARKVRGRTLEIATKVHKSFTITLKAPTGQGWDANAKIEGMGGLFISLSQTIDSYLCAGIPDTYLPQCLIIVNSVLNEKALVGAFNQMRALVGAFSVIVKSSRTFVASTREPCTLQRIFAAAGAEYIMLCECAHCAGMNRTLPRPWTWTPCQPVSHVTAPLRYQICSLQTHSYTHFDSFLRLLLLAIQQKFLDFPDAEAT